jgi:hypothetical protein
MPRAALEPFVLLCRLGHPQGHARRAVALRPHLLRGPGSDPAAGPGAGGSPWRGVWGRAGPSTATP